ncbi:MAG: HAD hydrolase family protein [Micromonosporaceae bacterium]|nr:HAD hydrolase family protein [Micromonosporaceae bacterium]
MTGVAVRADADRRDPLTGRRLVALDFDGTVIGPDGAVSARTVRAVKAVLASGVEVVPVTARMPGAVLHPGLRLGIRGEAICASGAARVDLRTGRLTWRRPLSPELAAELAGRVRAACLEAAFGWVHEAGVTVEDGYPYPHPDRVVGRIGALTQPVVALFARCDAACRGRFAEQVRGAVAGLADLGACGAGYAEVVRRGVCKLAALRELCADRGVPSGEVLAFGDGAADAPMLRWAGHGVAVGDGVPEALRAADRVAAGCADDGVAAVLEEFVEVNR